MQHAKIKQIIMPYHKHSCLTELNYTDFKKAGLIKIFMHGISISDVIIGYTTVTMQLEK